MYVVCLLFYAIGGFYLFFYFDLFTAFLRCRCQRLHFALQNYTKKMTLANKSAIFMNFMISSRIAGRIFRQAVLLA